MKAFLVGATALALASVGASAQQKYTMQDKCVVANQLCFIVRAPAGDLSSHKRVDLMNDRLAYILGYERLNPSNITIHKINNQRAIYVGRSLLIDVTHNDAKSDGTTTKALSRQWLSRLRAALPQARPTMYSGYPERGTRREARR